MKFILNNFITEIHQEFGGELLHGHVHEYDYHVIKSPTLMIIFDERGYVKAESTKTFDKWSKAYYKNGLPCDKHTSKLILKHLRILNLGEHIESAYNNKYFWDIYVEEHEKWD